MSNRIPEGRLPGFLGYQLRRAHTLVFQSFAEQLEDLNVTPGQVGLILTVEANPGISQAALARALGVERATLGEALERLTARGILERRPAPDDRRSHAVHLTGAGQQFVERLIPRLEQHERLATAALSDEERRTLTGLLGRLTESNAGS
ncbi:MAG: MarR family winged helix-turn-helix transcriptional regulator [Gammaproteobacteria bacterium]